MHNENVAVVTGARVVAVAVAAAAAAAAVCGVSALVAGAVSKACFDSHTTKNVTRAGLAYIGQCSSRTCLATRMIWVEEVSLARLQLLMMMGLL